MIQFSILVSLLALPTVFGELSVRHQWKYIDYKWENEGQKLTAINKGEYNYAHIFTIDVDHSKDGRTFVTTPRQNGVPASLSTVSEINGNGGPLLTPYPSWAWHEKGNCDGITSVYRVAIDECDRLWVLDNGKFGDELICNPQLLAFNLTNNSLIKKIRIPLEYARNKENNKTLLVTPVVETYGPYCQKTWVYMADIEGWGMVIYNGHSIKRLSSKNFQPDNRNFEILGTKFQLDDGLISMAILNKKKSIMCYNALASVNEYCVSTSDLKSEFYNPGKYMANYGNKVYTFPSQITIQAAYRGKIILMGSTDPPAIQCWNSNKKMTNRNVVTVARDNEKLQFTSGLKVKNNELWITTNGFQKIITGTLNFDEINYRILTEKNINDLIQNTVCAD